MRGSYPEVTIPRTEARSLVSSVVGQEYSLSVWLPPSYDQSDKAYPVVYVLDANICFGMAADVVTSLLFGNEIPEVVVVGIGYPVRTFEDWQRLRARDLTPTAMAEVPGSGGADRFLSFMRAELFPFVEASYRVDAGDRSISGYSYGGLLVLHAMLSQPGLFRRHAASSPSVSWDDHYLLRLEEDYASRSRELPTTLFMSTGSLEEEAAEIQGFDAILRARRYHSFHDDFLVLDGETHLSVVAPAFVRGVKSIFAPDRS